VSSPLAIDNVKNPGADETQNGNALSVRRRCNKMVKVIEFLNPSSKGMVNGKSLSPKVESTER